VTYLVALDRPEQSNLSWIYLPHESQGPANRVTYMSGYSPNNAPEGKSSLLVEITCRGGAPVPGQALEGETLEGLESAGLISPSEVLFTDRSEVSHAYVVFDHGYGARREVIFRWMDGIDLIPLGRFGRYEYDNSDLCVGKARALAAELLVRADRG
jgi:protoporphyrinogen oxidase